MDDRDNKGRFAKGNKSSLGIGRPPKAREERYAKILMSTVTFSEWKKVIEKALASALEGDIQAIKFLTDRLVGVVQQKLDLTTKGDKLSYTPNLDEMTDAQRTNYFSRLSIAISGSQRSIDLENTESEEE